MEFQVKVEQNKVVSFHYTVTDGGTEPVDSSRERGEPLTILVGHGNIIPGLENALVGRAPGERFEISVAPASFAAGSSSAPSQPRRLAMRARIAAEFSPTPAVKTRASSPPSAAASMPAFSAQRCTK